MAMIFFLVFFSLVSIVSGEGLGGDEYCIRNSSDLVYTESSGKIDTYQTFLKCLSKVNSPKLISSLNSSRPVEVKTSVRMNNIGNIDPKNAFVELDFYLTLEWQEDRLAMPIYWESFAEGVPQRVHLDRIFYDSAGIFIWRPDIFFHDGLHIETLGESFYINSNNTVYWQRHMDVRLSQQHFTFAMFPDDTQLIKLRYGSFGYEDALLNLSLSTEPFTFVPNLGVATSVAASRDPKNDGLYNFYLHSEVSA